MYWKTYVNFLSQSRKGIKKGGIKEDRSKQKRPIGYRGEAKLTFLCLFTILPLSGLHELLSLPKSPGPRPLYFLADCKQVTVQANNIQVTCSSHAHKKVLCSKFVQGIHSISFLTVNWLVLIVSNCMITCQASHNL